MSRFFLFVLLFVLHLKNVAQIGKDGAKTITTNTIVNEYTSLSIDANAGDTSITVNNSILNNNNRFSDSLSAGDLIMIIQMQGATIDGIPNDSSWGAITNYNNCGLYEFLEVESVPDLTTIVLACPLKNNYTASGRTQIVRIPRYTSLTINIGGILTCDAWDGTVGGIATIEVQGSAIINTGGSINVSGKGFRGGILQNTAVVANPIYFASNISTAGAQKGEGIAGYQTDYTIYGGMFCMGAPANGGGGGNSVNAAGGGGANAGDITIWTGNGNPDTTTSSWISAWNLEYSGFSTSHSSGGGKGGYSWSGSDLNALTIAPGNASWGGNSRRNTGGKGGRPLDYSTGRIFLGGGGGAGHENDFNGGAGGAGGGIVYLLSYGTISGNGSVMSNGSNGQNTPSSFAFGDGVGGGGAGGTILINSVGSITGIAVNADGGNGGNHFISNAEAEGGGGGGGGGYIGISNGIITRTAKGGNNGTTNSTSLTEFPSNGATKGGDGMPNEIITTLSAPLTADAGPDITICNGDSVVLSASSAATYLWNPTTDLSCINCQNPIASPTVTTDYVLSITNSGVCSSSQDTIKVIVNPLPTMVISGDTSLCSGQTAVLTASGASIYQWSTGSTNDSISISPITDTAYGLSGTENGCTDSTTIQIIVHPLPTINAGEDDTICSGKTTQLIPSGGITYQWLPSSGLDTISSPVIANPLINTTYTVIATDINGCSNTDAVTIIVKENALAAFTPDPTEGQAPLTVSFNNISNNADSYQWSFGDDSLSNQNNPVHTYLHHGEYPVILIANNQSNCPDTAYSLIKVKTLSVLWIPNCFTPDNNARNDRFTIYTSDIKELETYIYNRWGELIYQWNTLDGGWDGNYKGSPAEEGIYIFLITAKGIDDVKYTKTGHFSLIR